MWYVSYFRTLSYHSTIDVRSLDLRQSIDLPRYKKRDMTDDTKYDRRQSIEKMEQNFGGIKLLLKRIKKA